MGAGPVVVTSNIGPQLPPGTSAASLKVRSSRMENWWTKHNLTASSVQSDQLNFSLSLAGTECWMVSCNWFVLERVERVQFYGALIMLKNIWHASYAGLCCNNPTWNNNERKIRQYLDARIKIMVLVFQLMNLHLQIYVDRYNPWI